MNIQDRYNHPHSLKSNQVCLITEEPLPQIRPGHKFYTPQGWQMQFDLVHDMNHFTVSCLFPAWSNDDPPI